MKKTITLSCVALMLSIVLSACKTSFLGIQIPKDFKGRKVNMQGVAHVNSSKVVFYLWDQGVEDGDKVTFYVNGVKKITNYTLLRSKKKAVKVNLKKGVKNYILVYANKNGESYPNTCAISFFDGIEMKTLSIESDHTTNGGYHIIVP